MFLNSLDILCLACSVTSSRGQVPLLPLMTVGCLLKDDMLWLQATLADATKIATKTAGIRAIINTVDR